MSSCRDDGLSSQIDPVAFQAKTQDAAARGRLIDDKLVFEAGLPEWARQQCVEPVTGSSQMPSRPGDDVIVCR